jgi:hypothetical protein
VGGARALRIALALVAFLSHRSRREHPRVRVGGAHGGAWTPGFQKRDFKKSRKFFRSRQKKQFLS